jgi:aspartate aminotransferase
MPFTAELSRVSLPPVKTEIINRLMAKLQAQGKQVVSLLYGQSPLPISDAAAKAGSRVYDQKLDPYAASAGIPELRASCAANFQKMGLAGCQADDVVIGCGSLELLELACRAVLSPGDQAAVVSPYYFLYPPRIIGAGAEPVVIATTFEESYKVTPEKLREAIARHPRLKLLFLNTPNNPSAAVYTRLELEALGEVLADTNIWLFADEVYHEIVYDGAVHVSPASLSEGIRSRTATFDSASKTDALAGERVGWMTGPARLIADVINRKVQGTFSTSLSGQHALLAAMTAPDRQQYLAEMRSAFAARRTIMLETARKDFPASIRFHSPDGTFYFSFELPADLKIPGEFPDDADLSTRFAIYLLEKKLLAVTPGEACGHSQLIRLSFATDPSNIQAASRIGEALHELGVN